MWDPPWPSGYDAWLPSVSSQVRVSAGSLNGLAWSLYKCEVLWRTVYGLMVTMPTLNPIPSFLPSGSLCRKIGGPWETHVSCWRRYVSRTILDEDFKKMSPNFSGSNIKVKVKNPETSCI